MLNNVGFLVDNVTGNQRLHFNNIKAKPDITVFANNWKLFSEMMRLPFDPFEVPHLVYLSPYTLLMLSTEVNDFIILTGFQFYSDKNT